MTEGISEQLGLEELVKKALEEKEVNQPCPRCGNSSFSYFDVGTTAMFTVFCKRCGFKLEHLLSILLEKTEEKS